MVVKVRVKRRGDFGRLYRKIRTAITGPTKVKVGLVAGQADSDVIDRGFFNEFGTKDIPERPFMRLGVKDARAELRPNMHRAAKAVMNGSTSMRQALGKFGVVGQGSIQDSITKLSDPPNAPSTIAQKGSSNPLIDTGEMRAAITWEIDE